MNFTEARNFCKSLGGDLVCILSQEEQEEVLHEMNRSVSSYVIAGGVWKSFWGFKGWTWINGHQFKFHNWEEGELGNFQSEKNCIFLNTQSGKWKTESCSKRAPFLCEVEPTKEKGNRTFEKESLKNSSYQYLVEVQS